MNKINPINVANLLLDDISKRYSKSSAINEEEIQRKNHLLRKYMYYYESCIRERREERERERRMFE